MLHEELHTTPDIAEPASLSDYEIERNKPMPNIIHGASKQPFLYFSRRFTAIHLCLSAN
ncbi:MAG: hypothetical protein JNJ90_04795 [Saprospiraceae bacterium]|jgi:hypothetical protein|nr:hypothetical protein [Saprospiraceae bacterium]